MLLGQARNNLAAATLEANFNGFERIKNGAVFPVVANVKLIWPKTT